MAEDSRFFFDLDFAVFPFTRFNVRSVRVSRGMVPVVRVVCRVMVVVRVGRRRQRERGQNDEGDETHGYEDSMKFRRLPITSVQDTTQNFEQLQAFLTEVETKAWVGLTLSAKLEAFAGFQTAAVRTENRLVRLRGVVKVKAGEELKANETITTLPEGFRPSASVVLPNETAGVASFLTITAAGVVTSSGNAAAATGISLDGATFNLT